jgi:hypothetical protein
MPRGTWVFNPNTGGKTIPFIPPINRMRVSVASVDTTVLRSCAADRRRALYRVRHGRDPMGAAGQPHAADDT